MMLELRRAGDLSTESKSHPSPIHEAGDLGLAKTCILIGEQDFATGQREEVGQRRSPFWVEVPQRTIFIWSLH